MRTDTTVTDTDTEPIPIVGAPAADIADGPADRPPSVSAREVRSARRMRKRYERGEVKRFTQRSRRRRAVWLISLGSVALILLVAVLAAFSPLMAVTKIEVLGTSRLNAATVSRALDSQLGKPLPLVDFGVIKNDLAKFPLIRSYSTETHPPGTLIVRIVERRPLGLLKVGDKFNLVDAAGVVIATTPERPGGYPLITMDPKASSAQAKTGFAASAAVLAALPASVLPQVDSVTAKTRDDVTLTLLSGQKVLWGSPDQSELKAADLAGLLKNAPDASGYDVSSPQSPVTQ